LLEVLDPAQNHSFRDHYLDVELDLSQVMFLATANVPDTIPGPLLDRMEVIRFDGYTSEEKLAIAKGYLWPRQRDRNGLRDDEVEISDDVLRLIIADYTREAGVRNLERELGTVLRKTATRIASSLVSSAPEQASASGEQPDATAEVAQAQGVDGGEQPQSADGETPQAQGGSSKSSTARGAIEFPVKIDVEIVRDALGRQKFFQESAARTATPGVATGLAVTGAGGDVLFVEATAMKNGGKGGLVLTGQLGDVMKESAQIALSYVRGHAEELGIEEHAFENREFHVHVPAGAIPKDGPSAGVTMVTALASLLSGRPVKHTVGMTGEVTLQGRVLPIGGLKQKALAAHAAGLTDVILPERNRGDLDEIPEEVRKQMTFHPVMTVQEVLDRALEPARDVAPLS
jgi:ATP-dependent Lon protease